MTDYNKTGSWVPNVYSPGLRNVGSYKGFCTPWITGSIFENSDASTQEQIKIEFPYVTRRVVVYHAHGTGGKRIRVAFQDKDEMTGTNYFVLDRYEMLDLQIKCKELYLSEVVNGHRINNIVVYAELTNIPTSSMFHLTGSGITT